MTNPKRRRPLLLTGPYLAMWLWLIVPCALHLLMPLGAVSERHVSLHLGGWVEELDGSETLGETLRILRKDRLYNQCRYLRVNKDTTALVLLPPKQQHCALLRLTRPSTGHVVRKLSNAEFVGILKRTY